MSLAKDQEGVDAIDEETIQDYTIIKWRTMSAVAQENFRVLFRREEYSEHFSISYFQAIGERWRELQRLDYRLSIMFFALVVFMGVVESGTIPEISILGVRVSNDNSALPIFVLVASMLLIFSSTASLLADRYESVIRAVPFENLGDDVRNLFTMQFGWEPSMLFEGMTQPDRKQFASLFVVALVMLAFSSMVLAAVVVEALQFFLFVGSVLFVFENPTLPAYVNAPIVFLAGCATLLGVGSIMLKLPMPYTDYSNLERLNKLERDDPSTAYRIRMRIAEHGLRKERRNVAVLQIFSMLVAMVVLYLARFGREFFSDLSMLGPLAVASFVLVYVVSPLLDRFERRIILGGIRLEDEKLRTRQYIKNKKTVIKIRILVSLTSGLVFFVWFEVF